MEARYTWPTWALGAVIVAATMIVGSISYYFARRRRGDDPANCAHGLSSCFNGGIPGPVTRLIGCTYSMAGVLLCVAAPACVLCGCAEQPKQADLNRPDGLPGRDRVEEIRSMAQSFADSYVTRMASLVDQAIPKATTPEERALFHQVKVLAAIGAYTAACEPNPVVGVADLTAFVTLRHMAAEQFFVEHPIGDEALRSFAAAEFAAGEREAWEMMARIATPDQVKQLRTAITSWRDRNPQSVRFMLVRLGEFNQYRRIDIAASGASVPSNLLQWLYLDPMSSLDPATRQIAESRRLAARAIFYAERTPLLLAWETRQAYLDVMASVEAQALLQNSDLIAKAFDRTGKAVEQWPAVIAAERQVILESLWTNLKTEREATVAGLSSAVRADLEVLLKQSAEAVRVEREAAITQMSETIRQEREAVLHDLSARSPLDQPIAAADAVTEQRIEQAYARALRLLIIALVGTPVSLLLYRLASGYLRK